MVVTLFTIVIGIGIGFLCFWLRKRNNFALLIDLVPGPEKKLIFGNMLDFPRDGYGKYCTTTIHSITFLSPFVKIVFVWLKNMINR